MVSTKYKVSVSVSEETLLKIREAVRNRKFRNRSHAFESAINSVLWGENEQ
jgi:Arc/MetJ-type ribon-helix-helix transcriptional regulator